MFAASRASTQPHSHVVYTFHQFWITSIYHTHIFFPRRACASRVTVVVACVCLSVCPSVPALAASVSVETSKQRYSRVSLGLFLD